MKAHYIIEIIKKNGSAKNDLDRTVEAIEKVHGAKIEYTNVDGGTASIEVLYDAKFTKHMEFVARFLPTIIDVESLPKPISAVDFWKKIVEINQVIGNLGELRYGKQIEMKKKDLTRTEYEDLIMNDRKNDVIFVIPSSADPSPYYDNNNIVIYDEVKNTTRTIRVLGTLGDLTLAALISRPIMIYPNQPEEYDLKIDEVNDVLQEISEITRSLIMTAIQNGIAAKLSGRK